MTAIVAKRGFLESYASFVWLTSVEESFQTLAALARELYPILLPRVSFALCSVAEVKFCLPMDGFGHTLFCGRSTT